METWYEEGFDSVFFTFNCVIDLYLAIGKYPISISQPISNPLATRNNMKMVFPNAVIAYNIKARAGVDDCLLFLFFDGDWDLNQV